MMRAQKAYDDHPDIKPGSVTAPRRVETRRPMGSTGATGPAPHCHTRVMLHDPFSGARYGHQITSLRSGDLKKRADRKESLRNFDRIFILRYTSSLFVGARFKCVGPC